MENQTTIACVDQVPVVECTKIILIRHQVSIVRLLDILLRLAFLQSSQFKYIL